MRMMSLTTKHMTKRDFLTVVVAVLALVAAAWEFRPVSKLPADYGMDNPPVTICIKDNLVVPCK